MTRQGLDKLISHMINGNTKDYTICTDALEAVWSVLDEAKEELTGMIKWELDGDANFCGEGHTDGGFLWHSGGSTLTDGQKGVIRKHLAEIITHELMKSIIEGE